MAFSLPYPFRRGSRIRKGNLGIWKVFFKDSGFCHGSSRPPAHATCRILCHFQERRRKVCVVYLQFCDRIQERKQAFLGFSRISCALAPGSALIYLGPTTQNHRKPPDKRDRFPFLSGIRCGAPIMEKSNLPKAMLEVISIHNKITSSIAWGIFFITGWEQW